MGILRQPLNPPEYLCQVKEWKSCPYPSLWIGINQMTKKTGFRLRNFNITLKHVCPFCLPIAGCSWFLMLQGKAKHDHELWRLCMWQLVSERKNPPGCLQRLCVLLHWTRRGLKEIQVSLTCPTFILYFCFFPPGCLCLSHEAPCERGQASSSFQQGVGGADTTFFRVHRSHVVFMVVAAALSKRESCRKDRLFTSRPC